MGVSVVETIVLCRPRILWPSVNGCRCTCCPELPPWLSNFRPPPPCGCDVFWRIFFLSVQASWSRYHATFPSFALLHGPMHSNPPYTVSLYHLFRLLWIIQKNIFHIRTLSLLLLHFLSLYLPNHSPPPFYQWCDGPHFSWCSSEGCFFLSTCVSLGLLISGFVFNAATGIKKKFNLLSQTVIEMCEERRKLLRSLVWSVSGFEIIKTDGLLEKYKWQETD